MTPAQIITLARSLSATDTTQVNDTDALLFLNEMVYRDCINKVVVKVNENFFYDEWRQDFVAGQRQYPLLVRTASQPGMKRILRLGVKYQTTDVNYRPVRLDSVATLENDLGYFATNQSMNDPFYFVAGNSVFVYPTPTVTVPNGIYFYGISDPINLLLTDTEDKIKLPSEFHYVMATGLQLAFAKARKIENDIARYTIEYTNQQNSMLSELSDRCLSPSFSVMPSISYLN